MSVPEVRYFKRNFLLSSTTVLTGKFVFPQKKFHRNASGTLISRS